MSKAQSYTALGFLLAFGLRSGLMALLWWVLTDGEGGWYLGLPFIIIATLASLWLTPPAHHHLNPFRLPRFACYFILQSLRAGWDVARRTLNPRLPLNPGILEFDLHLPPGAPRWWLMIVANLLPGTLSVRLDDNRLELHCLDCTQAIERDLRTTEAHIAALFADKRHT